MTSVEGFAYRTQTVRPIDLGWWCWRSFVVCADHHLGGAQVASQVGLLLGGDIFTLERIGKCGNGNHWRVTRE